MSRTQLGTGQVLGEGFGTLQQQLIDLQNRVGYIKGQVNTDADLVGVTANIDDQIFVKATNSVRRKTADGWINVTAVIDPVNTIVQCTSLTRPIMPPTGQHIFETDTLKTLRNIGTPASPVWEVVGSGGSGGSGGGFTGQVTKMNVVASVGAPVNVVVEIPETLDFKRIAPEVLKFQAGGTNIVTTLINFDNTDAANFEANPYVQFDGVMKLKTVYQYAMTEDTTWTGTGKLYSVPLNKAQFKTIEKIEVL